VGGWVGGWLVKSDYITTPSAILWDGTFLWAECGNRDNILTENAEFLLKTLVEISYFSFSLIGNIVQR
jgi:hypothetical protein